MGALGAALGGLGAPRRPQSGQMAKMCPKMGPHLGPPGNPKIDNVRHFFRPDFSLPLGAPSWSLFGSIWGNLGSILD